MARTNPAVYSAVTVEIEKAEARHPGLITSVDLLDGLCYESANGRPEKLRLYAFNPELRGEVPEGKWFLGGSWLRETPHLQLNAARMHIVVYQGKPIVAFELPSSVPNQDLYARFALNNPEILETIEIGARDLASIVNASAMEMDRSGANFSAVA